MDAPTVISDFRKKPQSRSFTRAPVLLDPMVAADEAGLRYVSTDRPGITRLSAPQGFIYRDSNGNRVRDAATLQRIRSLAIPPAYTNVWICKDPRGHLQAVGQDARGRKQYRYHLEWRAVRDQAKYAKLQVFAQVLPKIRARVEQDLDLPGLPRNKVLAAIVSLLERTLARVGNKEYARTNKSFGLTTLHNRHVRVNGGKIAFDFRAKHGIQRRIDLEDRRLARIVRKCQDLPGQELFQYLDEDGSPRSVSSDDVNGYLREITGDEITAKDFRTWAGTKLAVVALRHIGPPGPGGGKKNVVQAVTAVAKLLGNTAAICRKCYIHPAVIEGYLSGKLEASMTARRARARGGLVAEEIALVKFLQTMPGIRS
ncbi:MAG TPA: DNA topoisomerase IB [Stellaceae bacterium]|jgi:DNA topoisomerase-1